MLAVENSQEDKQQLHDILANAEISLNTFYSPIDKLGQGGRDIRNSMMSDSVLVLGKNIPPTLHINAELNRGTSGLAIWCKSHLTQ